jgi:thiol-disulfide isomerase/thioredoxin
MKKNILFIINVMLLIGGITGVAVAQSVTPQGVAKAAKPTPAEIQKLKAAVEAQPDSLSAHKAYIKAMGVSFNHNNPELIAQYKKWIAKYPKNVNFPLAIGEGLSDSEMPEAKQFLLKVVEMDPKNAKVWEMLSFDADRWGQEDLATEYMHKASLADPADPSYAFYYLLSFENIEPAKYSQMVHDFAKRFHDSERGAQAMYWLAERSNDLTNKIKYFEELREMFPPQKFDWAAGGMGSLFYAYIQTDPAKALSLADSMTGTDKEWVGNKTYVQSVIKSDSLATNGNYKAAIEELNTLKTPWYYTSINDFMNLKKASLQDKMGDTKSAYDSLVVKNAKSPSDKLWSAAEQYGNKLGKSKTDIAKDIQTIRDSRAVAAKPFDLGLYTGAGKLSLNDLKGKVVLLTFWFPGCGPCRGEFPHFQSVMNGFKDNQKVAFIGINVAPEQDSYVVPFMKNTKYSFTPLHGTDQTTKDYGVRGEPENFLIDKDGKIVYRDFRIEGDNHRTLELMINSLL